MFGSFTRIASFASVLFISRARNSGVTKRKFQIGTIQRNAKLVPADLHSFNYKHQIKLIANSKQLHSGESFQKVDGIRIRGWTGPRKFNMTPNTQLSRTTTSSEYIAKLVNVFNVTVASLDSLVCFSDSQQNIILIN